MAATSINATGDWGIDANELNIGVIVEGLDETTRTERNYQKNHQGERTGAIFVDESIEVKLSGKLTANSPFSTSLGANITLANTISSDHLANNNSGFTIVNEVKRTAQNEDWKGVEVDIEVLPFFS